MADFIFQWKGVRFLQRRRFFRVQVLALGVGGEGKVPEYPLPLALGVERSGLGELLTGLDGYLVPSRADVVREKIEAFLQRRDEFVQQARSLDMEVRWNLRQDDPVREGWDRIMERVFLLYPELDNVGKIP